jgi:hypothetical protein
VTVHSAGHTVDDPVEQMDHWIGGAVEDVPRGRNVQRSGGVLDHVQQPHGLAMTMALPLPVHGPGQDRY